MNDIPLCEGMTMRVTDEKGRSYNLKYLTELDKQVRYLELTRREEAAIEAAEDASIVDAKERRLTAWLKVQEERRSNILKWLTEIDEYISIFADIKRPLRLYEKFPLYELIQKNIGVLTGLTGDEIKN